VSAHSLLQIQRELLEKVLPTGPPLWVPRQICAEMDQEPHAPVSPSARGHKARLTWELPIHQCANTAAEPALPGRSSGITQVPKNTTTGFQTVSFSPAILNFGFSFCPLATGVASVSPSSDINSNVPRWPPRSRGTTLDPGGHGHASRPPSRRRGRGCVWAQPKTRAKPQCSLSAFKKGKNSIYDKYERSGNNLGGSLVVT